MPFMAALVPAIVGGAATAAVGAGVNALAQGQQSKPQPINLNNPLNDQKVTDLNTKINLAGNDASALGLQAQQDATRNRGIIDQQQALANALGAQGGIQNQSSVYSQQQALANQLGALAQGQGPSVAQNQLNQATGQNVASQASLAAGQRGAGANVGLIARQAALAGSNAQQQAAGQAASLRAQEQLNAIGALQNQQGMLGNTAQAQIANQQGSLAQLGSLGQNQEQLSQRNQQIAQNQQALAQQQQQAYLQALTNQNQQQLSQQQGINEIQNKQGMQNANLIGQIGGGIAGGLGTGVTQAFSPTVATTVPSKDVNSKGMASTHLTSGDAMGDAMRGFADGGEIAANSENSSPILKENYKGKSKLGALLMAHGGKVHNLKGGGKVPGKAMIPGPVDSYKNDTIDAKLSPGEIVLPRSVTQSPNPSEAAARFVAAIKSKKMRA